MVATIQQIIGKVNPYLYAENGDELLKKYKTPENIPAEEVKPKAIGEHTIVYTSYSETLEPIYYFVNDLMNDFGLEPEKLVDNFTATPGGTHFQEIGLKAARMQEEASKLIANIGVIVRGLLTNVYDLRDFKIRLQSYDDLRSKDEKISDAARLALKQIWIDKVDITKGNSSISMMARQVGFQTLFDAFYVTKDARDADKLDLNDRVKRMVKQRIQEFNIWIDASEKELRKRYEIQRNYLKSQVNTLKLYSRWVKPYLTAARDLEMKDQGRNPDLVKAFNRTVLELTLLGTSKLKPADAAAAGDLPSDFEKMKIKREYFTCILVDFVFRAVPQQGNFIGKSEITFRAYALNQDEIDKINQEMDDSDLGDMLTLIQGVTTESLGALQDDINEFLEETENDKKQIHTGINPFKALVGGYDKPEKSKDKEGKEDEKKIGKLRGDNWVEKTHLRPLAAEGAEKLAFKLFDIYKKAHRMPSYT